MVILCCVILYVLARIFNDCVLGTGHVAYDLSVEQVGGPTTALMTVTSLSLITWSPCVFLGFRKYLQHQWHHMMSRPKIQFNKLH